MTKKTDRAVTKYGAHACRVAYFMHIVRGSGAATVAIEGPAVLKTWKQADAAINAGRELAAMDRAVWC